MQKIFNLSMIPDFNRLDESVKLAEKYGLNFEYNDFFIPSVYTDENEVNRKIEAYMSYDRDRSNDTLHGAFLDITIHSNDPVIAEYSKKCVRQSMEIARKMQIKGVVFHTGLIAGFKDYTYVSNWIKTNDSFFRQICTEYSELEVYMENMFDFDYEVMLILANSMSDVKNFGVCLDYAHASISHLPAVDWLKNCAPYIKHIHINDNDFVNDLHLPLGHGEIDWSEFKDSILELINSGELKKAPSILFELKGIDSVEETVEYFKCLFE